MSRDQKLFEKMLTLQNSVLLIGDTNLTSAKDFCCFSCDFNLDGRISFLEEFFRARYRYQN